MLERKLKDIIPRSLSVFPKFTPDHDPYYYQSWDIDSKSRKPILRYWFWDSERITKNRKRVFIEEIAILLKRTEPLGFIERKDYHNYCPNTNRAGDCGFEIIVGILDYLKLAKYINKGKCEIINKEGILQLIEE
jgi:hypothetical protein